MGNEKIDRRKFIKNVTVGSAAFMILPSGIIGGQNSPNNKLNIALIGAEGRGRAHYKGLKNENVVALCDVDENHLASASKEFPNADHYVDWRKCLDRKDLDAVVCCTADHTHAFIAMWSMNRGLHLFLEKPMGISVEEVRLVRATYLKNKDKIATQHGTQRHAKPNFDRVKELIRDGAIGELAAVHSWGDRQLRKSGYPKGEGNPPKNLKYDLWIGPSPYHPYSPSYFGEDPNCLNWNMYWDFGMGQIGDMGSHTMDLVWNAIDAEIPIFAEALGEEFNPEVTPVELTAKFKHPANKWRPEIDVIWYQGGHMPQSPREYIDLSKIGHGAMFKGDKGFLISSFDNRIILPFGDNADMSYYNPPTADDVIQPMGDFQMEWINACKSDLKTTCDFKYSGDLMEQMLLGLVAYRVGKKIEYDGVNGRITNSDKANNLLKREYRPGWKLNG